MIYQVLATFAGGVFFGAAVYINLVEQPARLSCGTPLAVTEWRPSYKRATLVQVPLALVGSLSAFIAWRFEDRMAWLIGGLLLLLVIPFTLTVILPTNKRLESPELDLHSEGQAVSSSGGVGFMQFAASSVGRHSWCSCLLLQ